MQKVCAHCSVRFEISIEDLALLDKVSPAVGGRKFALPPPTLCFHCRLQRRLSFHNELHLYRRTCDLTGNAIIAMYPPNAPVKVYDCDAWYSDRWDPLEYGRDIDLSRPFFEQFHDLLKNVPQLALSVVKQYNMNSDFTNNNWKLKNCYMISDAEECENCYYGKGVEYDRNCVDSLNVFESELCYECVHCTGCYNLKFSRFCKNSWDSWFLRDCIGCKHCFGCANLRQKQHCIFNEQKTEEEYRTFLREFRSSSHAAVQKMRARAETLFLTQPVRAVRGEQNIDSLGDNLDNSKNAHSCFDSKGLHDCRHMTRCTGGAKDSADIHIWGSDGTELCLEGAVIGKMAQHTLFSYFIVEQCKDVLYSMYCMHGCSDLFGCVGLRRRKHCILNKQYTKEEYDELAPKVIAHMQSTEEWGEFFPAALSPFGYNETDAQNFFPLSKNEALRKGFRWNDYEPPVIAERTIPASQIPDDSSDVPDDILNWALVCEKTSKPYKIIEQELDFYRDHSLPIPREHPLERLNRRFAAKNPYQLWQRHCAKCGKEVRTTYAPERPEIVYCESCYLKTIY